LFKIKLKKAILKHLPIALIAITFYCYIIFNFDFYKNFDDLVFLSVDAKSYEKVGNWIFGNIDSTPYSEIRPFLYPLILKSVHLLLGNIGVSIVQGILWLITVILLYKTLVEICNNKLVSYFSTLFLILNVSSIVLTLHGLSETLTMFLLCLFCYFLFHNKTINTHKFWAPILFISALLTCIRPIYQFLTLFVLFYSFASIYVYNRKAIKKYILYIFLALFPVFIQLIIMKTNHDVWSISKIGEKTIKNYYYSLLVSKVENISLIEAQEKVKKESNKDMLYYIINHPRKSIENYKEILIYRNLQAPSSIAGVPVMHKSLYDFSLNMNYYIYWLHFLMVFLLLLALVFSFKEKSFEKLIVLACPLYLNILSSGLTFRQGDRIIMSSTPVWVVLYVFIIMLLIRKGKQYLAKYQKILYFRIQ